MIKRILPPFIISIAAFGIIYLVYTHTNLFLGMERNLLSGYFSIREPEINEINPYVSNRVRLIGYDEDSIAVIGKWPWQRYVHAGFLDKIERFSPETVMFDLIFAKSETIPAYITEKLILDKKTRLEVEETFKSMDREFAESLSRYDNVYLDLQLMERSRSELPESYKKRISLNEEIIKKHSLPAEKIRSHVVFNSLEPVIDDFIKNSHPVVINIHEDDDGVVRVFPLYFTYKMSDGSYRNVFTAALSLLKRFYYIEENNSIEIKSNAVVFKNAKSPVLDKTTHQPIVKTIDFETIMNNIGDAVPPENYKYNKNLFNFLVNNAFSKLYSEEKIPYYPLHIVQKKDNSFQVIDSWEVYEAAKKTSAKKINVIFYKEKDVEIETVFGNYININYAGKEKKPYRDQNTGEYKLNTPIPTESYKNVYLLDDIPDIPKMDETGKVDAGYNINKLKKWFEGYCEEKSEKIFRQAIWDMGERKISQGRLKLYMNRYPVSGKYYFYDKFFKDENTRSGELKSLIKEYPVFGEKTGQPPEYFLSENQIVISLMEYYREQFNKYFNKFIFTGGYAMGLGDVKQTPYASKFGINIIISAFNTAATENILKLSIDIPKFDIILLMLLSLMCGSIYGATSIKTSSIVFTGLLVITFFTGLIVFMSNNLFIPIIPMLFINIIIFVSIVIYKLLTEEKDKKFLKETFGNYLAPEIIDDMYNSKSMPTLGGEAKTVTAFFTDIEGFSSFSEILTAHQLVELLNEYLSAMTDILIEGNGTLDKYEGDAIIAFFGAPLDLPDQTYRACKVALRMQEKLAELREKWGNEKLEPNESDRNIKGLPPEKWGAGYRWPKIVHNIKMRIGINTGEIVVGNMGSSMRMNYTMMGDPVNLAARLEEAGKQFGVYTFVSEYTLDHEYISKDGGKNKTGDAFTSRFIDHIAVVGRSEPLKVYELWSRAGEASESENSLLKLFDEGMQHYHNMEWDKAALRFSESLRFERVPDGKTTPSEVFLKRCEIYKENPPVKPGEKWDKVFRLVKK